MKKFFLTILLLTGLSLALSAQWDKDVFSMRGRMALQDGKYAQAIENFNILVRLDTTDYWSFFYRGIAKYNLGDLLGARKDFDASVRLNPVFTNGYHYRAISKSRSGDYDDALNDLQTAISLRPGVNGLYFSRGVTYFLAQRFEEAVKDFDRYIRKDPGDPGAYLNRGASHLFLGDTTRAFADYNQAIKLDRFDPEGYIRRGRLYASGGDYAKAIKDMDQAIELESGNTFAYFNRALMYFEMQDYNNAMADLDRVLKDEPGNALSLYNRSIINANLGNYENALEDMDRVININPGNVLAYFNRAAFFSEMGRWQDALADYNKAIDLYPDFAKAYLNRSYVENMLGLTKASKSDYETAQKKVREYRESQNSGEDGLNMADTTRKYNSLIALDADFAKKDFNDELLQHRDIDIHLKPLLRFRLCNREDIREGNFLTQHFENSLLEKFLSSSELPIMLGEEQASGVRTHKINTPRTAGENFLRGLQEIEDKQYSAALGYLDAAVRMADESNDKYQSLYKAFYLMNRGSLKADMIDFIVSMGNNVQTLTLDNQGTVRARVNDNAERTYDYSEAIADMQEAVSILPEIPYLYFNLGNLYCLSSQLVKAIDNYSKAISKHGTMGEAYYNRGLVLIYLKDEEKACIDLSRAGELGVKEAYGVINKYCKRED